VGRWTIKNEWGHDPDSGTDREFAYSFRLDSDAEQGRQITVEWASGGVAGSASAARQAIGRYLGDAHRHPPRRLLVDRDGRVQVVEP
jgi:ribosomal protein S9